MLRYLLSPVKESAFLRSPLHLLHTDNMGSVFLFYWVYCLQYWYNRLELWKRVACICSSPHRLNGREFEWTPGVGDGQGGLACCNLWGRKESDTTERLNWTLGGRWAPLFSDLKSRAWLRAVVKSRNEPKIQLLHSPDGSFLPLPASCDKEGDGRSSRPPLAARDSKQPLHP